MSPKLREGSLSASRCLDAQTAAESKTLLPTAQRASPMKPRTTPARYLNQRSSTSMSTTAFFSFFFFYNRCKCSYLTWALHKWRRQVRVRAIASKHEVDGVLPFTIDKIVQVIAHDRIVTILQCASSSSLACQFHNPIPEPNPKPKQLTLLHLLHRSCLLVAFAQQHIL